MAQIQGLKLATSVTSSSPGRSRRLDSESLAKVEGRLVDGEAGYLGVEVELVAFRFTLEALERLPGEAY